MKTTLVLLAILGGTTYAIGQGTVTFGNSSLTLISANATPMPVSGTQQFIFGIFLGPATTMDTKGQSATFLDPTFQLVGAYNTNSAVGAGYLNTRGNLDVGSAGGWGVGSTVDFIVRGWSTDAGATWTEALANWNNGEPLMPMFIGSSTVGNNLVLVGGGGVPPTTVFGIGPDQIPGFDMTFVPEPSALALALLGGATLLVSRRGRPRSRS